VSLSLFVETTLDVGLLLEVREPSNLRRKSLSVERFKIYSTDLTVLKSELLMKSPRLILVLNVGFCSTATKRLG
jgi:hypothetical protein